MNKRPTIEFMDKTDVKIIRQALLMAAEMGHITGYDEALGCDFPPEVDLKERIWSLIESLEPITEQEST